MASTKKPKISKELLEKNKELKTIDEMYRELDKEIKKRNNDIIINKKNVIDDVFENGNKILDDIRKNEINRKQNKDFFINFILEKYGKKFGDYNYLDSFSYEDLVKYCEYKISTKQSFFKKILKFLNFIK